MQQVDSNVNQEQPIENGRKPDGTFAEGNQGGPGRPKGSVSIIAKIKKKFEENPEYFDEYVDQILKDEKLRGQIMNHIDGAPKERKELEVKLPQFIVDIIKDGITDQRTD